MRKNLYKIPDDVLEKIKASKAKTFVAGCAVKFSEEEIKKGVLNHLGIVVGPDGLQIPDRVVPPSTQGKYSDRNINGEEIIRTDLPKETHHTPVEAPNWGDSSNGTHTVWLPHEAYPREFNAPRLLELSMSCFNPKPNQKEYLISFRVEEVLEVKNPKFNKLLLEDLNLLQENVGSCGVEESTTSIGDYVKSLNLSWEILPPGTKEETLDRIFGKSTPEPKQKEVAESRYDFFMKLRATRLVFGKSGFRRYFGALLDDDLVVFENIQYGNAIYILFDKWEELSKKSRLDILSGNSGSNFYRVIHTPGWKSTVKSYIKEIRDNRKKTPESVR